MYGNMIENTTKVISFLIIEIIIMQKNTRWLRLNDKDILDHAGYAIAQNTLYAYAPGKHYTTK